MLTLFILDVQHCFGAFPVLPVDEIKWRATPSALQCVAKEVLHGSCHPLALLSMVNDERACDGHSFPVKYFVIFSSCLVCMLIFKTDM